MIRLHWSAFEGLSIRRLCAVPSRILPRIYLPKSKTQHAVHLACMSLQRNLYLSEISAYSQKQQIEEQLDQKTSGMLRVAAQAQAHLRATRIASKPDKRLRDNSPKLQWLMRTLESIKRAGNGDKVIVFTELRDIQRELQRSIQEHFGFRATVINGGTSTSGQSANSRQKLIDQFQEQSGFAVIILSTIAVGFGVTRCRRLTTSHPILLVAGTRPRKIELTDQGLSDSAERMCICTTQQFDAAMPTFEATLG